MRRMKYVKLKVLVALSGGVDSAVAAKLLVEQGYQVTGVFLHFWQEQRPHPNRPHPNPLPLLTSAGEGEGAIVPSPARHAAGGGQGEGSLENKCCSSQALIDARRVANKIGIHLYALNLAKIFKKQVVDNFLAEYGHGRTPNPCVRCNKLVKLGYLIRWARKMGFAYVATGHYVKKLEVRSKKLEIKCRLYKARDKHKDQSYFLYTLSQAELAHLLFPLGNYTKPQVRQLAKKFALPVAEKKESQEICFIAGKSHNEFLKRHLKLKPGPIMAIPPARASREGGAKKRFYERTPLSRDDRSLPTGQAGGRGVGGEAIGQHQGLPLYTIGQRKGLEISHGPFYVARMDYKTNALYVVASGQEKMLYKNQLKAKKINWLAGQTPKMPLKCQAVIRYHHQPANCLVTKTKSGLLVKFKTPQRAITAGQSVVFCREEEVLGGGIIK